ncbi:hypothetical protein PMIN01_05017 [Paraphaeosphaeria minitans]|uniref:Uncharacterized protein n=1 Tax=Paraphaeosphaeria minitans TaxID=565426 RepID=A0A9P6GKW3_9PLEO|nr:hypothetical protein PMIN01_05017 [Paraphaeosphaeria minitans]
MNCNAMQPRDPGPGSTSTITFLSLRSVNFLHGVLPVWIRMTEQYLFSRVLCGRLHLLHCLAWRCSGVQHTGSLRGLRYPFVSFPHLFESRHAICKIRSCSLHENCFLAYCAHSTVPFCMDAVLMNLVMISLIWLVLVCTRPLVLVPSVFLVL